MIGGVTCSVTAYFILYKRSYNFSANKIKIRGMLKIIQAKAVGMRNNVYLFDRNSNALRFLPLKKYSTDFPSDSSADSSSIKGQDEIVLIINSTVYPTHFDNTHCSPASFNK